MIVAVIMASCLVSDQAWKSKFMVVTLHEDIQGVMKFQSPVLCQRSMHNNYMFMVLTIVWVSVF